MVYSFFKKIVLLWMVSLGLTWAAFSDTASPQSFIEPAALDAARIRSLQHTDPGLDGHGVVIATVCRSMTYLNGLPQNDYRFNMRHHSLNDADVLFDDHSDGSYGISQHATAIAGILVGLDNNAEVQYKGVCPSASVNAYEFWRFAGLKLFAQKPLSADIVTLSLGDIFEDWWTRAIENLADDHGTVIVAAIGNGQAVKDTVLYPAAGANVIGVGVINSALDENGNPSTNRFTVPTAQHSSQGPTYDLRCKPDIVAPGTAIVPDALAENGYSTVTNASSLAAPMVAGTCALLLQRAKEDASLSMALERAPTNCVIKAVLMNSAQKLPYWHKGAVSQEDDAFVPLDLLQGAGALDAQAAMRQFTAGKHAPGDVARLGWDSRTLAANGNALFYTFEATDPNTMLTVTLTWNRHFENQYPFRLAPQQSDLRLELWGIDSNTPDGKVLLDVSDSPVDTVEHLWTRLSLGYTRYAIAVRFSPDAAVPMPALEPFALAWSVGPDTSAQHPLWHDLNGDGNIDALDSFIELMLDKDNLAKLPPEFVQQNLKLSNERIELLTALWHQWKPYLAGKTAE